MEKFFVALVLQIILFNHFLYVYTLSVQVTAEHHQHHKRHHREPGPNMWTILGQTIKSDNSEISPEYSDTNEYDNMLYDKTIEHHRKRENSHHSSSGGGSATTNCPKCHSRPEIRLTEQELTELRIKYVKNQILKKLKLKERPQVSISDLPKPVAEGATIFMDSEENSLTGIPDEYYGKTTQKIIFPEIGKFFVFFSSLCFSCKRLFQFNVERFKI